MIVSKNDNEHETELESREQLDFHNDIINW